MEDDDRVEIEFDVPLAKPSPWFQPPVIQPNLGNIRKRQSLIPRSKVEHVLLHDNKNQQNMCKTEVNHLRNEHNRQKRMTELHKRAFLVRQSTKQVHLWEQGIDRPRILPELVVEMHLPGAKRASMESSLRRYSLALRSSSSKRGSTSAPMTSSLRKLGRSQSFYGFDMGQESRTCSQNITREKTGVDSRERKSTDTDSPRQKTTSGRLPRKPVMNSVSVPAHVGSPDSLHSDRSKTAPLNLTKSFTTYDTKIRREVTIADPRNRRYRASEDPRFKRLKTTLIPPEKPIDALLQLSPSGRKVVERYGRSLYDYNELKSMLTHLNKTFPRREREREPEIDPRREAKNRRRREFVPFNGYLPISEAFVDDESLYNSPLSDTSSMIFTEAE